MEKISALNLEDLKSINPGQTKFFFLEDTTCLNRCRALVHYANYTKVSRKVEKFITHFDKSTCAFTITAVKKA